MNLMNLQRADWAMAVAGDRPLLSVAVGPELAYLLTAPDQVLTNDLYRRGP